MSKRYDGPEGPYTSPWTAEKHFVIQTLRGGERVWAVVRNNQQPTDTTLLFTSRRDANSWLRENGFTMAKP